MYYERSRTCATHNIFLLLWHDVEPLRSDENLKSLFVGGACPTFSVIHLESRWVARLHHAQEGSNLQLCPSCTHVCSCCSLLVQAVEPSTSQMAPCSLATAVFSEVAAIPGDLEALPMYSSHASQHLGSPFFGSRLTVSAQQWTRTVYATRCSLSQALAGKSDQDQSGFCPLAHLCASTMNVTLSPDECSHQQEAQALYFPSLMRLEACFQAQLQPHEIAGARELAVAAVPRGQPREVPIDNDP